MFNREDISSNVSEILIKPSLKSVHHLKSTSTLSKRQIFHFVIFLFPYKGTSAPWSNRNSLNMN